MRSVLKYGGSSVATSEKIKDIAQYIKKRVIQGDELVVVVSAMGKTTDGLLKMAREISQRPNLRELDRLLSTGEQQTISMLAIALSDLGVQAISLTGVQAGLITDTIHTKSKIKSIDASRIESHLSLGQVVIIAGFQGVNEVGDVTTLGRGGSDTSAVAFAAALGARAEIYTDVSGIFSADPRVYKQASQIAEITYEEMMEMANLGSKVMEVRSVELGKKYRVEIFVGKSLEESGGTLIKENVVINEEKKVTGVATVDEVALIEISNLPHVPGTVAMIFKHFAEQNLFIDMITQTSSHEGTALSFTINANDIQLFEQARIKIEREDSGYIFKIIKDLMKLSVVGVGMASHSGVATRVFETLGNEHISIESIGTSEISISVVINKNKKHQAVNAIANAFDL